MLREKHEDSHTEARANFILGRLGFSWEELKGKRILDIGAGSAEFGAAARKKGIDMVSIDLSPFYERKPYQKEGYVQGSGYHLPFADESFDIVVSHASVPLDADDREHVIRSIEEMRRVLKRGGECRFGPVGMGGALFPMGDLEQRASGVSNASWEEEDTVDEKVRKTSLKTTALLRELVPDLKNSTDDPIAQTNNFYSFKK